MRKMKILISKLYKHAMKFDYISKDCKQKKRCYPVRCILYILSICCKCVASTLQVNQIPAFFFNFHKRKTPAIARVLNLFESRKTISLVIEINALRTGLLFSLSLSRTSFFLSFSGLLSGSLQP